MRKVQFLVTFIIITCILCGCYSPYDTFKQYPWYRAECWHCEEIDMTICFSVDEHGNLLHSPNSLLTIGDATYDVEIEFQHNSIGFFSDLDGDGIPESILSGTWVCRGEQMVITISEDSVLDGKYSELTFQMLEQP